MPNQMLFWEQSAKRLCFLASILLIFRARSQRQAEKITEDAAAEHDALRAFLDARKISFVLFIILLLCIVIVQQRSKILELIELNKDSDLWVRRLKICLKDKQTGDDLMMSLRRFEGK